MKKYIKLMSMIKIRRLLLIGYLIILYQRILESFLSSCRLVTICFGSTFSYTNIYKLNGVFMIGGQSPEHVERPACIILSESQSFVTHWHQLQNVGWLNLNRAYNSTRMYDKFDSPQLEKTTWFKTNMRVNNNITNTKNLKKNVILNVSNVAKDCFEISMYLIL